MNAWLCYLSPYFRKINLQGDYSMVRYTGYLHKGGPVLPAQNMEL